MSAISDLAVDIMLAKRNAILVLTWLIHALPVCGQQIEGPIETRVDQWQPVLPGMWIVSSVRSDGGREQSSLAPTTRETLACPYASLLILRSHAAVKLGEPGCMFHTYRLSKTDYHTVAKCRTLAGKDHYEASTFTVSVDGKSFSSATTWTEPKGAVTVRTEGVWSAACLKE